MSKHLPPEIRQMILDLSDRRAMEPPVRPAEKKRNQAIQDLNQYLAKTRRPVDEQEREKLLSPDRTRLIG